MAGLLPPMVLTTGVHNDQPTLKPMRADRAERQQSRRKGGLAVQRTGQAHKWDSTSARRAAKRRWRKRRTANDRLGTRTMRGRFIVRLARRPAVTAAMRETIRAEYSQSISVPAQVTGAGTWWCPDVKTWYVIEEGYPTRRISERAALVRLGHLRNYHGYVPDKIIAHSGGTGRAKQRKP